MTIKIEWQDQFGRWQHYQSKQNQEDAYRVAKRRAESKKSVTALWILMETSWISLPHKIPLQYPQCSEGRHSCVLCLWCLNATDPAYTPLQGQD